MVINHVPANAPSHMRQTIGLESAAACTSMYDGCHPWANDGPIFVVVREHANFGGQSDGITSPEPWAIPLFLYSFTSPVINQMVMC